MVKNDKMVTKETYAKCLISKLDSMIDENQKAKLAYDSIKGRQNGKNCFEFFKILTPDEKDIFNKGGRIHSKAAISRVRIELNKVLIEIEREM